MSLGIKSLSSNIRKGNYKGAIVDGIGIALDAAALATPFVPGGAATAIKAVRGANKVSDALKTAKTVDNVSDVGKGMKNASFAKNAERELAARQGKEFIIITGPQTHLSKNILDKEVVTVPWLGPQ